MTNRHITTSIFNVLIANLVGLYETDCLNSSSRNNAQQIETTLH